MAKRFDQVRYYFEGSPNNYPTKTATYSGLMTGNAFSSKIPIVKLGIQTLPGVKFHLNNGLDSIMVGSTGVYELDLDGMTEITALCFEAESLNMISSSEGSLLIDFIYDDGEGS